VKQRTENLDLLRGFALLLVFTNHISVHSGRFPWLNPWMDFVSRGGWVGVDLFFVLSGFLISKLLFDEYNRCGHVDVPRFLIRRGFKIYPSYYVMLGLTAAVLLYCQIPVFGVPLFSFFSFTQNYWIAENPFNLYRVWGHTWSLAVEEQFYFILPLLLVILIKTIKPAGRSFRVLPGIFLVIAVVCCCLRVLKSATVPYTHEGYLFPLHLRADALFFGVWMAYMWSYRPAFFLALKTRLGPGMLMLTGLTCFLPAFLFSREDTRFIYTIGFSLFYIGSGFLLGGALTATYRKNFFSETLRIIGIYSYTIYLWHMPMNALAIYMNKIYPSGCLYLMCYFAAPVILGILLSRAIERPLLYFREKIMPARVPGFSLKQ